MSNMGLSCPVCSGHCFETNQVMQTAVYKLCAFLKTKPPNYAFDHGLGFVFVLALFCLVSNRFCLSASSRIVDF